VRLFLLSQLFDGRTATISEIKSQFTDKNLHEVFFLPEKATELLCLSMIT